MNPNIHDQFQSSRQLQSNRAIYPYSSPGDLNASVTNPALSAPYMSGGNFSQLNLALGLNYGESVDNSQLYQSENVSLPLSNSNFDLNTSRAPGHMLLSDFSGQNLQSSSINQQSMVPNYGDQEMAPTDNNLLKLGPNMTESFSNLSSNMQLGNGVMLSGQYSPRNSFVTEKSNAIRNFTEIQSLSGNENTQIPWNSNDFANNSRSDFNSTLIFQADNSEQNTTLDNSTPSDNSAANYGSMFSASPSHFSPSSQFFRSYPGDSQLLPPHSSLAPSTSNGYVATETYSHITNNGSLNSNPTLRTTEQQYNMESDGVDEQSDFSLPQNYSNTNTVPSHGLSNSSNRQTNADNTGSQPNTVPTRTQSPKNLVSDLTPSQFLKSLSEFMNRRNTSITQLPYIGTQLVNLWALYSVVTSLGGMLQVRKKYSV
ncbi:hypothetical protein K7432_006485 [Basidiobolus ranarum]|uniref:ARID domain-containing protein n=1 Tax=Basidiobolus ranarum TaxID=34480 RepID=A0ABR2W1Z7_9FUNG